ncbi:MAG: pilus assembly protein [Clostridiales bacterium]|nr:pilus assembly protein [Clostridiales bacterium]
MKKYFTGSTLKIIAVISMILDHFSQIILKQGIILNAPYAMFTDAQFSVLLTVSDIFHILGRIAFPIFCFLLVEGFLHTQNLKKYFLNLGIFAVLSEPIYDWAASGTMFSLEQQNVLFTLLLGLCVLTLIKRFEGNSIAFIIITLIGAGVSYICQLDGWYYGIFLIAVFYLFHNKPVLKSISAILVMYICGLDFSLSGLVEPNFLLAVSSLIFINLYNGKRGIKLKYFFYWFYPAHLLLFTLVSTYIVLPLVSG